jgi:hypothetical protein
MWAFIISFFMIIPVANIWLAHGTLGVEGAAVARADRLAVP